MRLSKFPLLGLGVIALQGPLSPTTLAQSLAEADAAAVVQARNEEDLRAQASANRDAYQQTISTIEARQGVYTLELSEAYVGLGNALRTLDEPTAAAEAYGKALQALRIGYGLDDLRQLAVLEELRATQEALGDWDEVDSANHLMFYIAKHNSEASQELRVKLLLNLGRWIRKAAAEELISDLDANAKDLAELYDNEISQLEATAPYTGRGTHLAALYLDLAATELSEAKRKYEMPLSEFQTPGAGDQRTTTQQTCFTAIDRNGRTVQSCTDPVEVPNINFYLQPNVRKSTEIRQHLGEVENRVMQAFRTLQDDPAEAATQTELLDEVHRLTGEYNEFVALNKERPF
jgi:hypothetical protein